MRVYALIFKIGTSSGHEELIGIFDSMEKVVNSKNKHMKKYAYADCHYSVKEIVLNKEINYTIAEW